MRFSLGVSIDFRVCQVSYRVAGAKADKDTDLIEYYINAPDRPDRAAAGPKPDDVTLFSFLFHFFSILLSHGCHRFYGGLFFAHSVV